MPVERACSECGAEIPSDSKQGLCTRCLLSLGLKGDESGAEAPEADQSAGEPLLPPGERVGVRGLRTNWFAVLRPSVPAFVTSATTSFWRKSPAAVWARSTKPGRSR